METGGAVALHSPIELQGVPLSGSVGERLADLPV